jgi:pimeloyl-ACP methyl ester carboxylesterase
MKATIAITLAGGLLMANSGQSAPQPNLPAATPTLSGALPDGALWSATVPPNWNGTLLLWSHGYARERPAPEDAPTAHREALLSAGYAIAGSNYAQDGWAIESAVPDQVATIEAFIKLHGKPKRVIAWGMSMGGLITVALAERPGAPVDGALAMCGSISGAVGMMNMALDGAYAFRTLVAPEAGIELTAISDDMANAQRVNRALAAAQATPQGRARVALAGVLAGLPGWTTPGTTPPAPNDGPGQEAQMARTFTMGVFLPRSDQERRAGGVFSWNTQVDYREQLAKSGRGVMVEKLYRAANLDLAGDLDRLNAGPRVNATSHAVKYMLANYTPNGRPKVPVLAVQNIGDGLTSPSLQQDYLDATARRAPNMVSGLWTAAAGHCTFPTSTIISSIAHLEGRLSGGQWPARHDGFVPWSPPPMLRPCLRGGRCS